MSALLVQHDTRNLPLTPCLCTRTLVPDLEMPVPKKGGGGKKGQNLFPPIGGAALARRAAPSETKAETEQDAFQACAPLKHCSHLLR